MSSPSPQHAPAPPDLLARRLAALREELDTVDDLLHDALMRRAELVAQVGALGAKGNVPLRPGREASIIRRLLGRNRGALAPATLVRIWRELLAGSTAQQRPLRVVTSDPCLAPLAREQFGALAPVQLQPDPEAALEVLRRGEATLAVLRWPSETVDWWTALLRRDGAGLHIVARLPFWTARPDGVPSADAAVLTAAAPDPSGRDRSLLGFERGGDGLDLAPALAASGFAPIRLIHAAPFILAELDEFVALGDPRLRTLPSPLAVLGAYAIPVGDPV